MSAFGGWIQRIDATPFHFKLARRNGMHTKGMQGRGSRQSRGCAAEALEERPMWANVARVLKEQRRCLRYWRSMGELFQRHATELRRSSVASTG
jgi:hypothetical protein